MTETTSDGTARTASEGVAKKGKPQRGTIFKVYLLAKPGRDKQEGFIKLWKHKGVIQKTKYIPFDYLDELPRKIRKILKEGGIEWPPKANAAGSR